MGTIGIKFDNYTKEFLLSPESIVAEGPRIQAIPGTRFRGGVYRVPEICAADALRVVGSLPEDYVSAQKRDLSGNIASVLPSGRRLFDYQKEDAEVFYDNTGVGNWSDTGLGKTMVALAAFHQMLRDGLTTGLLWICPKATQVQFLDEARKHYGLSANVAEDWNGETILVINYDKIWRPRYQSVLGKFLRDKEKVICLDEAHFIGNYNNRSIRVLGFSYQAKYRWALTATPVQNRPESFYRVYSFISGSEVSQAAFEDKFCIKDRNRIIGYKPGKLRELEIVMRRYTTQRRKKTDPDIVGQIPEETITPIYVDMEGRQAELYDSFAREQVATIKALGEKEYRVYVKSFLPQSIRLLQVTTHPGLVGEGIEENSVAKLVALREILDTAGEQKVVIWSKHPEVLKGVADTFNCVRLDGTLSTDQRIQSLETFKTSAVQFIAASYLVAGEGLDGLQVASISVYLDLPWSPTKWHQSRGRLHRTGQRNAVTVYPLLCRGTLDEYVYGLLHTKQAWAADIIGDDVETNDVPDRKDLIAALMRRTSGQKRNHKCN